VLNVTVIDLAGRSDFDNDADVDLADFEFFQLCFSGPNHPGHRVF